MVIKNYAWLYRRYRRYNQAVTKKETENPIGGRIFGSLNGGFILTNKQKNYKRKVGVSLVGEKRAKHKIRKSN